MALSGIPGLSFTRRTRVLIPPLPFAIIIELSKLIISACHPYDGFFGIGKHSFDLLLLVIAIRCLPKMDVNWLCFIHVNLKIQIVLYPITSYSCPENHEPSLILQPS